MENSLHSALERSHQWMVHSRELIGDIDSPPTTDKMRLSLSLFHLSDEHQSSIHVLIENGLCGSAFALFRPQFEAFIRGKWFDCCEDEDFIHQYISDKEFAKNQTNDRLKIWRMIKDIEKYDHNFESGHLTDIKEKILDRLNDFTHGGLTQINARNHKSEITQRFKEEDVIYLLDASVSISLLASVCIGKIYENEDLFKNLCNVHSSLYEGKSIDELLLNAD